MSSSRTLQDHQAKVTERKKEFMKGIDPTESRRRREEQAHSIRKNKVCVFSLLFFFHFLL